MSKLLSFLNSHKFLTLMLGGSYYITSILLHEEVSKISVWFEKKLTIKVYNNLLTIIGLFLLSVFLVYVISQIRKGEDRLLKSSYLFFTIIMVVISFRTLLTVNVEYIHFFQYALLSIPIFAITLSFGKTAFWITLLGTIDEAYQYFILYPDWKYFDFNDVVLNLLGGIIGIMMIYTMLHGKSSFFSQSHSSSWKWTKSSVKVTSTVLIICLFTLYMSGQLQFYPNENSLNVSILLSRTPPPTDFWIRLDWGKTYHILHPIEGIILICILIGIYSLIDYRLKIKCQRY